MWPSRSIKQTIETNSGKNSGSITERLDELEDIRLSAYGNELIYKESTKRYDIKSWYHETFKSDNKSYCLIQDYDFFQEN